MNKPTLFTVKCSSPQLAQMARHYLDNIEGMETSVSALSFTVDAAKQPEPIDQADRSKRVVLPHVKPHKRDTKPRLPRWPKHAMVRVLARKKLPNSLTATVATTYKLLREDSKGTYYSNRQAVLGKIRSFGTSETRARYTFATLRKAGLLVPVEVKKAKKR